jgi:hypothetical protein
LEEEIRGKLKGKNVKDLKIVSYTRQVVAGFIYNAKVKPSSQN